MFKIDVSESYFYPVSFEVVGDGGKFDKVSFDAQFKRLGQTEIKEIVSRFGNGENPITDLEIIDVVMVGWKGIVASDGSALPYSEISRERVMEFHGAPAAIARAWIESISGSKAKN